MNPKKVYQELQPELEGLDDIRLSYYKPIEPFRYIFWSTFVLGGSYLLYLINFPNDFVGIYTSIYSFLSLVSLLVFMYVLVRNRKRYASRYMEGITPKLVRIFGSSFKYDTKDMIDRPVVESSFLFPTFNHINSKYVIQGSIENQRVSLNELRLTEVTTGNRSEHTVFRGFFIQAELKTIIPTSIWLTCIKNASISNQGKKNLNLDHVLTKKYKCYIDDLLSAQTVLQLLDHIQTFNDETRKSKYLLKNESASVHLSDKSIIIAIPSIKRLLKPKLNETFDSENYVAKNMTLFSEIKQLITHLNKAQWSPNEMKQD